MSTSARIVLFVVLTLTIAVAGLWYQGYREQQAVIEDMNFDTNGCTLVEGYTHTDPVTGLRNDC